MSSVFLLAFFLIWISSFKITMATSFCIYGPCTNKVCIAGCQCFLPNVEDGFISQKNALIDHYYICFKCIICGCFEAQHIYVMKESFLVSSQCSDHNSSSTQDVLIINCFAATLFSSYPIPLISNPLKTKQSLLAIDKTLFDSRTSYFYIISISSHLDHQTRFKYL